jgi:hypothetical protein
MCNKRNPRVGKRKKMNVVMQKIKLAFWGVMEGNVQSAKGTKTLNPKVGKNTRECKVLWKVLEIILIRF